MAKILSLNKLIKELAPLRDKKRIANSATNIVNKVIKADL